MRHSEDERGDWRGLDEANQLPRYAAIAEMLDRFSADDSVLDIGCGEALLFEWLDESATYTGIEPSAAAVRLALSRNPAVRIVRTSAERFDTREERFTGIIFNEVLYYTANPVGLLRKYAGALLPGGMILCSIFQKPTASFKGRLRHWLDSRRPFSNVHCTHMVRGFMNREGWAIVHERSVAVPGSVYEWQIWVAKPSYHVEN